MAGLNDTDIKLDENWQLTPAANGDAPVASGRDCIFQDIQLEALTQEGELFYDETWGWSLLDFLQSQDDELTRIEIEQRIKTKLGKRPEVDVESIVVNVEFSGSAITAQTSFSFIDDSKVYDLTVGLDRVKVEVVIV